jgi:anti-sigma-K factor RskA
MSDTPDPGSEASLAGEYVLGTLDLAEAEAARQRLLTDPDFAAEVGFWERRLAPLALLIPAVAPPANLWFRIEDSTGGAGAALPAAATAAPRPANDNRLAFWRVGTFAGVAIAAGLAAFIALQSPPPLPPPPAQPVLAVLTPYSTPTPVLVAVAGPNGSITVRPTAAIAVPTDRDLELWALAAGAKVPAPLGVIPQAGKTVPPGIAAGTTLLVSLEPKGGSPTGLPTGPVLYAGKLQKFD